MNKTAIKNFAIWARNKLIADISYRAGLMGITAEGIHASLPQSSGQTEFYDIGTAEPYSITGKSIYQRQRLVELMQKREKDTDYKTAYKYVIEEVAYTWFNRLIAVRFMEVNDYLPSHIRVLSSDTGKLEPDLVTTPFDADLEFTMDEQQTVLDLKIDNKLDEVFQLLFIKQCNALNEILPALFEKTNDYTELLLNVSVIDQDGVVYHLVHDIPEEDFDVERGGQVEIIGWLYQYYNTEPKNEAFSKKGKVTKEEIPAVTQLFTPDWIVRYMVENSLGRLWVEGHPNDDLKAGWKYYLEEAEQEPEVQAQLEEIRKEYAQLNPEDIKIIDPCMGSGHILIYAFDVLMQIYESAGYGQRDAARSILENNLYGLDIDDRAFQLAYFAVMMKARQYNRRILNGEFEPSVYSIRESKEINRNQLKYFGKGMTADKKQTATAQINYLLDIFKDAKEYGSILKIDLCDWKLLYEFSTSVNLEDQINFESFGIDRTKERLIGIIRQGEVLSSKYEVVITNPPYMGIANGSKKLNDYVKRHYPEGRTDLSTVFMMKCTDLRSHGFVSMINTPVWMFLTSFEKLRRWLLASSSITCMSHNGRGIFGSDFGTVAYVLRESFVSYKGTYVRLFNKTGDVDSLELKEKWFLERKGISYASVAEFEKIPGMPIAYWISKKVFDSFKNGKPLGSFGEVRVGLQTGDNEKFLRMWQEVGISKTSLFENGSDIKWFPHNKGGSYRKWYGNYEYLVNWRNSGEEIRAYGQGQCASEDYYLQEGISWSNVSAGIFSIRYITAGSIFDNCAPTVFSDHKKLLYFLGLMNSKVGQMYMDILSPSIHYTGGAMKKIPVFFSKTCYDEIIDIVKENISLTEKDWDSFESSWNYDTHPFLLIVDKKMTSESSKQVSIEKCYEYWVQECNNRFQRLKDNEETLNTHFISIYGLENELSAKVNNDTISIRKANITRDIKNLISYAIGCMFGRYSLDTKKVICAGSPLENKNYISFLPDSENVLLITDEEYLEEDLVSRLCVFLRVAFGESMLEDNLDFIAKALDNKGDSSRVIIRNYFLNDFFKDHCQTYSVTGSGKRPIYWLFDSGKQNGFKALIYLHRYTPDTIGNIRIDYLHRMQRIYESEIRRMQDMIDHSANAREIAKATKRREKLTKQLKECREYDEKLAHLALSRIELDLDDGVKVNYRKLQTANDGKFYEVLADSKNIMAKK